MIIIKFLKLTLLFLPIVLNAQLQDSEILQAIQKNQILSMGGCELINVDNKTLLISVSTTIVDTKNLSSLMRVGKVKADRDLAAFINGSNITSYTESYVKEEMITVNDSSYLTAIDSFVEYIREDSKGFIRSMRTAGYWYSDDKSLFLYAIYKEVNL